MSMLTDQIREAAEARAAYMLSLREQGEELPALLSRTYRTFLPEVSHYESNLMADRVIERLTQFSQTQEGIEAYGTGYIRAQLQKLAADLPLPAQCQKLYEIQQGLTWLEPAYLESCLTRGDFRRDFLNIYQRTRPPLYSGEMTEAARDELLEQVVTAISGQTLSEGMLRQLAQSRPREENTAYLTMRGQLEETERKALTIMAIYTLVMDSRFPDTPESLTLDQVVLAYCQDDAMRQMLHDFAAGNVSYHSAAHYLKNVWAVGKVFLSVAALLGACAGIFLTDVFLISCAAYIGALALVVAICTVVNDAVLRALDKAAVTVHGVHVDAFHPELLTNPAETEILAANDDHNEDADLDEDEDLDEDLDEDDFLPV